MELHALGMIWRHLARLLDRSILRKDIVIGRLSIFPLFKMRAHARAVMAESMGTESVNIILPLQIESCRAISFTACLLIAVDE